MAFLKFSSTLLCIFFSISILKPLTTILFPHHVGKVNCTFHIFPKLIVASAINIKLPVSIIQKIKVVLSKVSTNNVFYIFAASNGYWPFIPLLTSLNVKSPLYFILILKLDPQNFKDFIRFRKHFFLLMNMRGKTNRNIMIKTFMCPSNKF